MCMSCVANADLAVTGSVLGAAGLRLKLRRGFWRLRAQRQPVEVAKVRAET
jgi:hypothetical protein